MKNLSLAEDYFKRAESRLKALDTLFEEESWADVVREAQELVELALKGLLRTWNIEVPRVHDVSSILEDHKKNLSPAKADLVEKFARISRELRRDRELAFYGSEDLTPSEFYKKEDAERARKNAQSVVKEIHHLKGPGSS